MTLSRLAAGLRERGHTISIVRPRQPADGRVRSCDALTLVPGIAIPGYREVRMGLPASDTLHERWTACRPDVVYVATEGPLGWSAVRVARRLGLPVFTGFHTNFPDYARHYVARWVVPLVFRGLRRFHNRARATLVASEPLRRQLEAAGFTHVSVIGRGVDSALFAPERRCPALRAGWSARDDDLVALSVGRLAPEKNLSLAFEAFRAIEQVQSSARFVIVGDGPLRGELQRANRDVIFCGMQTGERLAAHYASADVFLFPSETETFGNVTLEAMASGLAVIAYDYAAAGLHIRAGDSGVLVARGDARRYIDAALALARSPVTISRMGRRAREHAAAVGWCGVVERFETLLTGSLPPRPSVDLAPARVEASARRMR